MRPNGIKLHLQPGRKRRTLFYVRIHILVLNSITDNKHSDYNRKNLAQWSRVYREQQQQYGCHPTDLLYRYWLAGRTVSRRAITQQNYCFRLATVCGNGRQRVSRAEAGQILIVSSHPSLPLPANSSPTSRCNSITSKQDEEMQTRQK